MIRRIHKWVVAMCVATVSVATAEAATITQCATGLPECGVIGTFSWDEDAILGHWFNLLNTSGVPDSPVAALDDSLLDFTSVVLTIDGTNYSMSDAPAGGFTDSAGLFGFDPFSAISSASISFLLLGTQFSAPFGTSFSRPGAVDIYAHAVPEPASALLIGTAIAAYGLARRRRSS